MDASVGRHGFVEERIRILNARLHAGAWEDLHSAIRYYESKQPGLGAEFFQSVEQALLQIEANPDLWKPDGQGRRGFRMKRFPFKLIYR